MAKDILTAIAAKDDTFLGSLMPEEVDADPTTLRRYEWDQLRNQLIQAGPKLSELARDKGIDQVVKVRAGEARLMLYHSDGQSSGQALVLVRTERGWLLTGSTYMRDDR